MVSLLGRERPKAARETPLTPNGDTGTGIVLTSYQYRTKRIKGAGLSRGLWISRPVKYTIAREAFVDRLEPRTVVAVRLEGIIREMGVAVPDRGTLEKEISKARGRPSPLDNPWSLADLVYNPIPPQALLAVLGAYEAVRISSGQIDRRLTIRQALWVARLHALFPADLVLVLRFAEEYAATERIYEAVGGQRFETSSEDADLIDALRRQIVAL